MDGEILMKKILILGGSGLIGRAVMNEMTKYNKFDIYSTYFQNPIPYNQGKCFELAIQNEDSINSILDNLNPKIIISCLRGDFNKQLILHKKVAEYLRGNGGSLYFLSTLNVFDNDFSKPHYEDDLPNPKTDYGQYKMECENIISKILHDNACILRISQVWGKSSQRMNELLSSLHNNKDIIVYPKLYHNTITDVMIAKQLCYIINNNLKGIYHLVPEDIINYKNFYKELIIRLGFRNASFKDNFEAKGYFALLSKRTNEFPESLRFNNKSVINYLID